MRKVVDVVVLVLMLIYALWPMCAAADAVDQLLDGSWMLFEDTGTHRGGERFNNWPASIIHSVQFKMWKSGSPTGWGYAVVRNVSDDQILGYLGSLDVSTLTSTHTWITFNMYDVEVSGARDIRVTFEWGGATGYVYVATHNDDVYGNASQTQCNDDWEYFDLTTKECTWSNLTYDLKGVGPPMGETLPATDIHDTTATLNGRVLDDGNYTCEGYFEWGKTPDPDTWFTDSEYGLVTGNYTSHVLTDLVPDSWYFYRLWLESDGGWDYADMEGFRTHTSLPHGVTNPVSDITATSATLNGYCDWRGETDYDTWAYFNIVGGALHETVTIATPVYSETSVTGNVTDLVPSTSYSVVMVLHNENGQYVCNIVEFSTLPRTVYTAPRAWTGNATLMTVFASGEWQYGAQFYGQCVDDGGLATHYGFQWRIEGASEWDGWYLGGQVSSGQGFYATKVGLERGETYEWRAWVQNSMGEGVGMTAVITISTTPLPTTTGTGGPPWIPPDWRDFFNNLSGSIKLILAIIITVGAMIVVAAALGKSKAVTYACLATGVGLVILFVSIGWFPTWVMLLIGAIIGLLIFFMLLGRR